MKKSNNDQLIWWVVGVHVTKIREPFANAKDTEGHKSNHLSSYDFHQEKEDMTIYIEFRFYKKKKN